MFPAYKNNKFCNFKKRFSGVVILVSLICALAPASHAFDWAQLQKMGQQIGNAAADAALRQGLAQLPPEVSVTYDTLKTNMTEGRFTLTNVSINRIFENERSSTQVGSLLVSGVRVLDALAGKTSGAENVTLENVNFRHSLMEGSKAVDNWVGKIGSLSLDDLHPVKNAGGDFYNVGRAAVRNMAIENIVQQGEKQIRKKRLQASNISIDKLVAPTDTTRKTATDEALKDLVFDRAVVDGRSVQTAQQLVSIIMGER